MKLYHLVFTVLTILIVYDGLNGEFHAPTTNDWIKWTAWVFLAIAYTIASRRKKS